MKYVIVKLTDTKQCSGGADMPKHEPKPNEHDICKFCWGLVE